MTPDGIVPLSRIKIKTLCLLFVCLLWPYFCVLVSGESAGLVTTTINGGRQWSFPYGVIIAVLIGVVLGVVIGSTLLALVYMCYRK